jgi:hypothetical protein
MGEEELRHALDLVDYGAVEPAYEPLGVGPRGVQDRLVVGREVVPPDLAHGPHQRGLSGAPGADHQGDRRVGQRFPQPTLDKACVQGALLFRRRGIGVPAIRSQRSGN